MIHPHAGYWDVVTRYRQLGTCESLITLVSHFCALHLLDVAKWVGQAGWVMVKMGYLFARAETSGVG